MFSACYLVTVKSLFPSETSQRQASIVFIALNILIAQDALQKPLSPRMPSFSRQSSYATISSPKKKKKKKRSDLPVTAMPHSKYLGQFSVAERRPWLKKQLGEETVYLIHIHTTVSH